MKVPAREHILLVIVASLLVNFQQIYSWRDAIAAGIQARNIMIPRREMLRLWSQNHTRGKWLMVFRLWGRMNLQPYRRIYTTVGLYKYYSQSQIIWGFASCVTLALQSPQRLSSETCGQRLHSKHVCYFRLGWKDEDMRVSCNAWINLQVQR